MPLPLTCCVGEVESVTQLHDTLYVLLVRSPLILRFDAVTHHRLQDIEVTDMMSAHDIAACETTSSIYVADWQCVWRVSSDGADIRHWLPRLPSEESFHPWTVSVRSGRLLMTPADSGRLIQFSAEGAELRQVPLPDDMKPIQSVESPAGTFVVSHRDAAEMDRGQVSEVDGDGVVLCRFGGSRLPSYSWPEHLEVDSRGNILVSDTYGCRVLLLDARLMLRRVIVDEDQLNHKAVRGLCFVERAGLLLVGLDQRVALFHLLSR